MQGPSVQASLKKGSDLRVAGFLYVVAGTVMFLAISLSETLYPNYSIHHNAISDLLATTANTSIIGEPAGFVWGICWLLGSFYLLRNSGRRGLMILYVLPAIGVLVAVMSPENVNVTIHSFGAVLAFVLGAIAIILSYRLIRSVLRYFVLVLGIISLLGVMLEFGFYYSDIVQQVLGPGGTERVVVYPLLAWQMSFGGYFTK